MSSEKVALHCSFMAVDKIVGLPISEQSQSFSSLSRDSIPLKRKGNNEIIARALRLCGRLLWSGRSIFPFIEWPLQNGGS
jgi:hypothetical protein